jgi:hypothetical protein
MLGKRIRPNIIISAKGSLGYFELKKYKPWFDEGCIKLLDPWEPPMKSSHTLRTPITDPQQ